MNLGHKSYIIPLVEILGKLFSFVNALIIIRILEPYDYGIYNYVLSFGLMISVFMDGGMNYYAFNSSVKDENKDLSSILNTKLVLSIFVIFINYAVLILLSVNHANLILFFSINLLFTTSIAFFKVVARGKSVFSIDILGILGEPFIRSIALVIAFLFFSKSISLSNLLLAFASLGLMIFVLTFTRAKKRLNFDSLFFWDYKINVNLLKKAKFFLFYYFCLVAIQRIDIFFINSNLGAESLGFFSASYNLYLILQLFIISLIMTKFKKAIGEQKHLKKLLLELFALTIIIIIAGSLLSKQVFELIYPPTYHNSYIQFNYLLWGLPFYIITALSIHINNYNNKAKTNSIILFGVILIKATVLTSFNLNSINEYVILMVLIEAFMAVLFIIKSKIFKPQSTK